MQRLQRQRAQEEHITNSFAITAAAQDVIVIPVNKTRLLKQLQQAKT
jgi:hypothetical protein